MTGAKQKAIELVKSFKDYVNPYIGSGMLSNDYDNNAILFQCKKCAHTSIEFFAQLTGATSEANNNDVAKGIWQELKSDIDLVTVEDIFDKN